MSWAISIPSSSVAFVKAGLLLAYGISLSLPGYIFFNNRGGADLLTSLGGLQSALGILFPLFGLYAFTFVANQALIGPNTDWLSRYFVNINYWHRRQGVFALTFAILHPLAILVAYGFVGYWHRDFVSPDLAWWILPAYIGLSLLLLTALTAIINWKFRRISWWRSLHRLNYLVFVAVWLHSWFIGSDVQTSGLRYIWLFYLIAVSLSFVNKYRPRTK